MALQPQEPAITSADLTRLKVVDGDDCNDDAYLELRMQNRIPTYMRNGHDDSDMSVRTGVRSYVRAIHSEPRPTLPKGFVKTGVDGEKVKLLTNYFTINPKHNMKLQQYHVKFYPHEESTDLKKKLFRSAFSDIGNYIFDGNHLYKPEELPPKEWERSTKNASGQFVKIKIKHTGEVHPKDHMYLQFYNIVMRKGLGLLGMTEIGRNFYNPAETKEFPSHGLDLLPGYVTAIKNHENSVLLCVEVTHRVLRTKSVYDEMMALKQMYSDVDVWKNECKKHIVGSIVMTTFNYKTYCIEDIRFDLNPMDTFVTHNGSSQTYAAYNLAKYNCSLQGELLCQPMLVSKPKKKVKMNDKDGQVSAPQFIYLVPSLCRPTGLSDGMRNNYVLMKSLSEHLHMEPTKRKRMTDDFLYKFRSSQSIQKELKAWKMNIDYNYVTVNGRKLPLEPISLSNRQGGVCTQPPNENADWTQLLNRMQILKPKQIVKWLFFVPAANRSIADEFLKAMYQQARKLNISMQPPLDVIAYRPHEAVQEPVLRAFERLHIPPRRTREYLDLVFWVLPSNQIQKYAEVKKVLTVRHELISQCFLVKNLKNEKNRNSICSKLLIQLTAKLGGIPWEITIPFKSLMVFGFDVYHCSDRKGQSCGALVATSNNENARFYSATSFHKAKMELSDNLCRDTSKCLDAYLKRTGTLPSHIFLFRDGVGEGQINFVLDYEVHEVIKALTSKYEKSGILFPKFSFIIVTKKINTRAILCQNGGKFVNPGPGTVIDDVITSAERYDFFLISPSVRQGTVSPTHYNVVRDSSELTAGRMQRLAYKMCHTYYNWSGTVAVPAPCQYAHKLAYLTGISLYSCLSSSLGTKLWYL